MFSSTGLFKQIQCPRSTNCLFLNCIFSHDKVESLTKTGTSVIAASNDPVPSAELEEPPLKKRRLSGIDEGELTDLRAVRHSNGAPTNVPTQKTKPKAEIVSRERSTPESSKTSPYPASIKRTVSPPLKRLDRKPVKNESGDDSIFQNGISSVARLAASPKENLTPRLIARNPAPHSVRLAILKKIHEQITRLNDEALRDPAVKDKLVLSESEVISMALDEEEKMGKDNPKIYKNVVGHRIQRLKKMKPEEWKSSILELFQKKYLPAQPTATPKGKIIETGLTPRQEIAILANLVTPLQGLEIHGYVTSPPTDEEIKAAQEGVKMAAGFERCDRCGTRFQVFPGRNSDEASKNFGRLTSTENGCTYHWSKPFRPPKSSTGAGEQESYYLCCRGALGSAGCTEANDHVFKISEVKRMASILQFVSTPLSDEPDRSRQPITFDCEMGYTTLGLEVIRLTAVSWPQNEEVLDVLVQPVGEVIDYNTRFSGVSQEHFSKALPYGAKEVKHEDNSISDNGELHLEPLRVVDSPMTARKLLFDLLTPGTPLLGHAIDNDLNTCRIIHPTIVDTVLLFPHPRGLPIRYGLKMLTSKYLERSIQTGGALGHDSKEDAIATGDLVRFKVGEKWKDMKIQGWTFENSRLIPPSQPAKNKADGSRALKRPASQLDGEAEET